jgi:hypothetical protein
MSAPIRPDKARAREALETRVRTRIARLHEALTRELAPYRDDTIFFDPQTHRLTYMTAAALVRERHALVREREETDRGMTIAAARATITEEAEAIVAHTVAAIWARVHSPLVPGSNLRGAVLGREELVSRWPWDEDHDASAVLAGLVLCLGAAMADRYTTAASFDTAAAAIGEPQPYGWPADG